MGRKWISGLKPKKNVGENVVEKIEYFIEKLDRNTLTTSLSLTSNDDYSHLINIQKISFFIKEYKAQFDDIHLQEIYKWKAFKHFQDHWNTNSSNFALMLEQSLDKTKNLLAAGNYWPRKMLIANSKVSEKKVHELFYSLVDEEIDLSSRILDFKNSMESLNSVNFPDKKQVYQDHRAILVYLSLIYPERYYLYKFKMFEKFVNIIDYVYKPTRGIIENIAQYLNMCDIIRNVIEEDQELLKLHKGRIDEDCYYDKNYNLLTQDFIYAVTYHLSKKSRNISESKKMQDINFPNPVKITEQNIKKINNQSKFKAKLIDMGRKQKQNKIIGDSGEAYVLKFENNKIKDLGVKGKTIHTSVVEGDAAGYDIQSVDKNGNVIYIEVKTTKGKCSEPFTITRTQLNRSIKEKSNYYLYRLFNYDADNNTYEIAFINGDLTNFCQNPETYKTVVNK